MEYDRYRAFTTHEYDVMKRIGQKYKAMLELFTDNSQKMRAILRVPRLTKQFQDQCREEGMPEYKALDKIYAEHFMGEGSKLKSKANDFNQLSVAEQSMIQRSFGDFEQGFNLDDDYNKADFKKPAQRVMTQVNDQRSRIRIQQSPVKQELVYSALPGGRNDGSLNTSYNLNFIQKKYRGLEQFLVESAEKKKRGSMERKRCFVGTSLSSVQNFTLRSSIPKTTKNRRFHDKFDNKQRFSMSQYQTDKGINWLNSSVDTMIHAEDLSSGPNTTRFMNDLIKESIEINHDSNHSSVL